MLAQHRVGAPMGLEVKRVGSNKWVSARSHGPAGSADDGSSIIHVTCPDGTGVPFVVNP